MACHDLPHRANIVRYGGDEFVALVRTDRPEEIDILKQRIHVCLKKQNHGSPFALTVSIGVAKAAKGMRFESLLKEADAGMYDEKKKTKPKG